MVHETANDSRCPNVNDLDLRKNEFLHDKLLIDSVVLIGFGGGNQTTANLSQLVIDITLSPLLPNTVC